MIHDCNVRINTITEEEAEHLGIDLISTGKWVPFSFFTNLVVAVRLTEDDDSHPLFGCTTIYMEGMETYIIDTPYDKFRRIWIKDMEVTEEDLKL